MEKIKEVVREIRTEAGLSGENFSLALGLSHAAAYHWEAGRARPSAQTVKKIIEVFGYKCPNACEKLREIAEEMHIPEKKQEAYKEKYALVNPDAILVSGDRVVCVHDWARTKKGKCVLLVADMLTHQRKGNFRWGTIRERADGRLFVLKHRQRFYLSEAIYMNPLLNEDLRKWENNKG